MLCFASLVGCQSKADIQITSELSEKILNDSTYKEYRENIKESAKYIALKMYDSKELDELINQVPENEDFCLSKTIESSIFSIRGGGIFYNNFCQRKKQIKELDKKYNYLNLSMDDRLKLIKSFNELNNDVNLENEIFNKTFKID